VIGATAQMYPENYADEMGATEITGPAHSFPEWLAHHGAAGESQNGTRISRQRDTRRVRTPRDSYAIWAAIVRQIALGTQGRVLSTPNGEQGKFFDLAKEFGLTDGVAPSPNPKHIGQLVLPLDRRASKLYREGCPINIAEMRRI
jgi:hypothetical protein